MKIFSDMVDKKAFSAKYSEIVDSYFTLISEKQLKDKELWNLLTLQFSSQYDSSDKGWRGEFWGKLMRGASLNYAYTKDAKLYGILKNTVIDLIAKQDAFGRITSYPKNAEFSGWDMWVRKYVMLGLEYFYDICHDSVLKLKIENALKLHADYIINCIGVSKNKISIFETSHAWGAINSVSIIQPFVRLFKISKEKKYLDFAKMLILSKSNDETNLFEIAFENIKAPHEYPITKAYEIISCFEGMLDYYCVTGEEKYLKTCVNFADKILKNDFTIVGGTGCHDEYFDNSTYKQVVHSEIHKQETCVTITLMKFLTALYLSTCNKNYLDAVECSFFNLYAGSLSNGNCTGHMAQPLFYSYSPVLNNPRWTLMGGGKCLSNYAVFGCCVAIGAAGAGVIPTVGVIGNKDNITINYFYAGQYLLKSEDYETHLTIESDYPYDGKVVIKIDKATSKTINIDIRKPEWCTSYSVSENYVEKNGYICINKYDLLYKGLVIEFNMPIRIINSSEVNKEVDYLFAAVRGAITLCADSKISDLNKVYKLKFDNNGNVIYRQIDRHSYALKLENEEELILFEYKNIGKNFYEPENISVWLKNKE